MPKVDIESVLARLNSPIKSRSEKEIRAFCPDHELMTGRRPSHANWTVNIKTGQTMCFTEGRASNLVFIVCRLFGCDVKEAIKFLTGLDSDLPIGEIKAASIKHRLSQMRETEDEKQEVHGLDAIAKDIENRYMSEEAYQFFIRPPGKQYPTNITKETVDRYLVFERTWGYYANRVIIPFVMRGLLRGFCALDLLGKERWLKQHPLKTEDDYRKVLYPMHFVAGDFLFGYDDCEPGADFIIVTEGPREVMKLWQEGFPNSVAILGSYLSNNQYVSLAELHPRRVVLMFDGDDAGVKTTGRIADKLKKLCPVQQCFVPRGKDPKNLDRADFERLIGCEK